MNMNQEKEVLTSGSDDVKETIGAYRAWLLFVESTAFGAHFDQVTGYQELSRSYAYATATGHGAWTPVAPQCNRTFGIRNFHFGR